MTDKDVFQDLENQLSALSPIEMDNAFQKKLCGIPGSLEATESPAVGEQPEVNTQSETGMRSEVGTLAAKSPETSIWNLRSVAVGATSLLACCVVAVILPTIVRRETAVTVPVDNVVKETSNPLASKPTILSFNNAIRQGDDLSEILWAQSATLLPSFRSDRHDARNR